MAKELPADFVTFAITVGFATADKWSEKSIETFKRSWRKIVSRKNAGQAVLLPVFSLLDAMNKEDDAFLMRSNFDGVSRLESLHDQSIRILVLYPQISEGTVKAQKKTNSRFVQIGFGLASTYKPRSLDRFSVKMDEHTTPKAKEGKSILYALGWSITGAFDDGEK